MLNFQDLPDELVLKILSFLEIIDLIGCGQVSERFRRVSHDDTLWVTANLEKKTVKAELLEMILRKGCRTLNFSHSEIRGSLSSNIKSQLRFLTFTPIFSWGDSGEDTLFLEELLSSCSSLKHLIIERVCLTPKMADSVCKNGKTLQILNLNSSYVYFTPNNVEDIFKCCLELKEVDLAHVNEKDGLTERKLELLAQNISPNVEKLYLNSSLIMDDQVKTLLRRCNKIKELSLEATWLTDNSLKNIRQYLNLTLEELSLGPDDRDAISMEHYERFFLNTNTIHWRQANPPRISFTGFLELKFMPRLKILNLYYQKDDGEKIQNLRQHLPNLMIKGALN